MHFIEIIFESKKINKNIKNNDYWPNRHMHNLNNYLLNQKKEL